MSIYSGKCDLYDHIAGLGGWYNRDGKPVSFNDPDVHVFYSDEYRDFLEFKKRTNGTMYQHKKVKVTEWNQDEVTKKTDHFKVIEHKEIVADKRLKEGQREKVTYTYEYFGREYNSLKELNKHGVYVTMEIHFETLLDLIPYYPYLVSMSMSDKGKEIVYLSQESFVDSERDDNYEHGFFSEFWEHYKRDLQDHYRDIVLTYFNPEGRENREIVVFDENRRGCVSKPIDSNFNVIWDFGDGPIKSHWTSPKVINAETGEIEISKEDYESYLGHTVSVYYVEAKEYPIKIS